MEQIDIAKLLLYYFDKVYTHVELIEDNNIVAPRYWNGNNMAYIGIDDIAVKTCYIRQTEDIGLVPFDIGGCGKNYNYKHYNRIVVYMREFEGSGRKLMTNIIKHLTDKDIVVKKIITDANKLVKQESSFANKIVLTGKCCYFAIDIESIVRTFDCCPTIPEAPCEERISNIICKI
jgi:hypothetical protein